MSFHTKLGLFVIILVGVLMGVSALLVSRDQRVDLHTYNSYKFNFTNLKIESESIPLRKIVEKNIDQSGTFGIYIENLTEDEKYGFNSQMTFPAASLYKLFLIAAVYQEVEKGNLTLTTGMSSTKTHLNSILGGVEYGYEDFPEEVYFTVEDALDSIARVSDNYAAVMLTEKIRQVDKTTNDPLENMAKFLEMRRTDFQGEVITTSPEDIGRFFKLAYQGKLVSPQISQNILDLLQRSQINDRIPARLPEGVKISHKTGELSKVRHDGGIVFLDSHPYIIVLLSKDLKYEDDGIAIEAEISKEVYDYFSSK